jgi:hypothetical protein
LNLGLLFRHSPEEIWKTTKFMSGNSVAILIFGQLTLTALNTTPSWLLRVGVVSVIPSFYLTGDPEVANPKR